MEDVFKIFFDLRNIKMNLEDDFSDRVSRLFSAVLIIILATIVSARQCLGEAIHCWCPEQCASNHEKYANLFCWVDDAYYVPFLDRIPHPDEPRLRKITYYQWVPLILMVQAMLFLIPWVIWRVLASRSGIGIGVIVENASKAQLSPNPDERQISLRYAVYLLRRFFKDRRQESSIICFRKCPSVHRKYLGCKGSCLFVSYLFVKLLYLLNAIGQIFLLDKFLGVEFYTFGYYVLVFLLTDHRWVPTDRFPHVTLCDFRIRQSTNVHQYTVQCVLPINIFNEKVFAVLWFWLVAVAIVTLLSAFRWAWDVLVSESSFKYVQDTMEALGAIEFENKAEFETMKHFSNHYLGRDGLFLLKLVAKNAGHLVAAELLCDLWSSYQLDTNRLYTNGNVCCHRSKRFKATKINLSSARNNLLIHDV